jgi:ubiquinone/menaquinone biosynthesis C-methylase UbiE
MAAHLFADLPPHRLRVVNERIETVRLPDKAFDIVASATAFHWVQADVALPKLSRALRPSGWLAVWWTEFGDHERPTEFRAALGELYAVYLPTGRRGALPSRGGRDVDWWCAELSRGGHFTRPLVELIGW